MYEKRKFGFGNKFGGRRGGPRPFREAPIKVGEEYDAEVTEISRRGDGIAKVKNFVVFVAGAKKGDKGKLKITEVHNRFAVGTFGEGGSESTEAAESNEEFEEIGEEEENEEDTEE